MEAIRALLQGSNGRFHVETRGINDLAYYAFAQYKSSKYFGKFYVNSQTTIEKKMN